ncbi:N-acetyltransferase [Candidatus Woesearchaeota archaeon]|nr:N-acetyltransferase [Candidatus Woesearchaeota archaeon]
MEKNYSIGENTITKGDVAIAEGVKIGDFCHLWNSKIGRYTKMGNYCEMKGGEAGITIGEYCRFQSFIFVPEGTEIGDNVFIAPNVTILNDKYPTAKKAFQHEWVLAKVVIGDNVTIGGGVTILPGVRISNGAFIGSGSVVTKDVESNAIMIGNPAKSIGYTTDERFRDKILKDLHKIFQ